jgi:cytochrome oxidase Cu insertion factor (SCO1/SenC/PrrC family)
LLDGPQEPKDVTSDAARDLSAVVREFAALKSDATHWLTDPEYATLRHHLEAAHAAAEAALVEARRRVRLNERHGE